MCGFIKTIIQTLSASIPIANKKSLRIRKIKTREALIILAINSF